MTNPTRLEQAGLCRALAGNVTRFATDRRGGVAVMFAVALVPMIIAVTAAVDYANAIRIKASLQAAADAGVLAAATALASGYGDSDKEKIAKDTFFANLSPSLQAAFPAVPDVTVDFPTQQVHMAVQVKTDQLLTSFITDSMTIGVQAAAIVDHGHKICLLVFNKVLKQAFNIQGTADVMAEECTIQVNSGHTEGMRQSGSSSATAKAFYVHGNYSGSNYYPKKPIPGAMPKTDPLAAKFAGDMVKLESQFSLTDCQDNPNSIQEGATFAKQPGVHCGGMSVQQGTLKLAPGVHVFRDGVLDIRAQGTLAGNDVTILLMGNSSTHLNTQAGANLIINAPSGGLFSGIVIAHHPDTNPSKQNEIIGGGIMDIQGIIYMPVQPLKITGNGEIGSKNSQFAIFADTLSVEGNGILNINISADYVSAGLPELPEANQTVRLVK
jgi:Flp pilus assembly protein TadG